MKTQFLLCLVKKKTSTGSNEALEKIYVLQNRVAWNSPRANEVPVNLTRRSGKWRKKNWRPRTLPQERTKKEKPTPAEQRNLFSTARLRMTIEPQTEELSQQNTEKGKRRKDSA